MLVDSIFRTGNNYHPQVFLEECKYVVKEKDVKVYYWRDGNSNKKISGEKISDEENSDEKMLMKKIKKIPV